jgi:hypothetical protein
MPASAGIRRLSCIAVVLRNIVIVSIDVDVIVCVLIGVDVYVVGNVDGVVLCSPYAIVYLSPPSPLIHHNTVLIVAE